MRYGRASDVKMTRRVALRGPIQAVAFVYKDSGLSPGDIIGPGVAVYLAMSPRPAKAVPIDASSHPLLAAIAARFPNAQMFEGGSRKDAKPVRAMSDEERAARIALRLDPSDEEREAFSRWNTEMISKPHAGVSGVISPYWDEATEAVTIGEIEFYLRTRARYAS